MILHPTYKKVPAVITRAITNSSSLVKSCQILISRGTVTAVLKLKWYAIFGLQGLVKRKALAAMNECYGKCEVQFLVKTKVF